MTIRGYFPSQHEYEILLDIALYRLLSVELLHKLGHGTPETIRKALRMLRRQCLVGSTAPSTKPAPEKAEVGTPHLFWLSPKGDRTLNELHGHRVAIGATRRFGKDNEIEHRLGIVAIHMAFRAWAKATGKRDISFVCDFEPGSPGRGKVTTIRYNKQEATPGGLIKTAASYLPDGYARFAFPDPTLPPQLMVVEFERGGGRGDLSMFFRGRKNRPPKLDGIREAAEHDVVEQAKALGSPAPYLIVFGTEETRDRALNGRWPDRGAEVWRRFFIKSLPEIEAEGADFQNGWWRVDGSRRDLYAGR
ncbi:hypothetical protein [Methylorubrum sp. SB2]|uniref:hypothetical protein n=1 Tax=Methylorubrum subtropicum TaxID=3138812 RepID=UPI00313CA93D